MLEGNMVIQWALRTNSNEAGIQRTFGPVLLPFGADFSANTEQQAVNALQASLTAAIAAARGGHSPIP